MAKKKKKQTRLNPTKGEKYKQEILDLKAKLVQYPLEMTL